MKLITFLIGLFFSFTCMSSSICGKDAISKNKLTALMLKKATILQTYKTKASALKGLRDGYIIDLEKSDSKLRDDEQFLIMALEAYPTKFQMAAFASNCHDIQAKNPQLYELASKRLKQKQSFKSAVLKSKYGRYFEITIE